MHEANTLYENRLSIKDSPLVTAVSFSVTDAIITASSSNQQPPNKRPTQKLDNPPFETQTVANSQTH